MSASSHILTLHDCEDHDRAVYSVETPLGERFDTIRVQSVGRPTETEWLWPGRIPLGTVTVIEGAAGSGKTRVAFDLAARAAGRLPWPDGTPAALPPADVLVIARQQEGAHIATQAQSGGGETTRVFQFEGFDTRLPAADHYGRRGVSLPDDMEALEFYLESHGSIGVVVFDPLTDFCRTPRQMAETLYQLNDLAARGRMAILVNLPADCRTDAQGRLRESSRSPAGAARCVWSIVRDPDDARRRLLVARRTNFCGEPDGLAFRLDGTGVVWEGESAVSPLDPLGELGAAERCLLDLLGSGESAASAILRDGAGQGFSAKQLRSAARRLGVRHRRMGFSEAGHWEWLLPGGQFGDVGPSSVPLPTPALSVQTTFPAATDLASKREEVSVDAGRPPIADELPAAKPVKEPAIERVALPNQPSRAAPPTEGTSTATRSTERTAGTLPAGARSMAPAVSAAPAQSSRRRQHDDDRKAGASRPPKAGVTAGPTTDSG
jgi:hypothetical protein